MPRLGSGTVVEGIRIVGIQTDSLIKIGDSLVKLAFVIVGKSPVIMGNGENTYRIPPRFNESATGLDPDVGLRL